MEDEKTIGLGESYLFATETYENLYVSLLNILQGSYNLNAPEKLENKEDISLSEIIEYLHSLD